jgi:phage gp36-like protein
MNYATVEDVISSFPHPVLPSVTEEPDYHTLHATRKMLRANARSIDTHLGGGVDISASSYQMPPMK